MRKCLISTMENSYRNIRISFSLILVTLLTQTSVETFPFGRLNESTQIL